MALALLTASKTFPPSLVYSPLTLIYNTFTILPLTHYPPTKNFFLTPIKLLDKLPNPVLSYCLNPLTLRAQTTQPHTLLRPF
jgi:hypothetical protein